MRILMSFIFVCLVALVGVGGAYADSSQSPFAKEFQIEINGTALNPPFAWAINGVTEPIQSLHPLMSDKKTALKLRPGRYYYTTSRFSFEFTVDLEGRLDFKKTLDQCIEGRGTSSITVTCSRTQIFSSSGGANSS
jgi:hypothetical protein